MNKNCSQNPAWLCDKICWCFVAIQYNIVMLDGENFKYTENFFFAGVLKKCGTFSSEGEIRLTAPHACRETKLLKKGYTRPWKLNKNKEDKKNTERNEER